MANPIYTFEYFKDRAKTVLKLNTNVANTTDTPLNLYGYSKIAYGEGMQQNFLDITSNFFNRTVTDTAITGMTWYDGNVLKLKTAGNWVRLVHVPDKAPDITQDQLLVYSSITGQAEWRLQQTQIPQAPNSEMILLSTGNTGGLPSTKWTSKLALDQLQTDGAEDKSVITFIDGKPKWILLDSLLPKPVEEDTTINTNNVDDYLKEYLDKNPPITSNVFTDLNVLTVGSATGDVGDAGEVLIKDKDNKLAWSKLNLNSFADAPDNKNSTLITNKDGNLVWQPIAETVTKDNVLQFLTGLGEPGYVLTSNGANTAPTFQQSKTTIPSITTNDILTALKGAPDGHVLTGTGNGKNPEFKPLPASGSTGTTTPPDFSSAMFGVDSSGMQPNYKISELPPELRILLDMVHPVGTLLMWVGRVFTAAPVELVSPAATVREDGTPPTEHSPTRWPKNMEAVRLRCNLPKDWEKYWLMIDGDNGWQFSKYRSYYNPDTTVTRGAV